MQMLDAPQKRIPLYLAKPALILGDVLGDVEESLHF
jgi:hypothetical protein